MDHPGVVWTVGPAGPVKMGDLLVNAAETRFSYTAAFLDTPLPGLAVLSSPRLFGRRPVVFAAREGFPMHPRLMAFVPGQGRRNIQRRVYARILARRNPPAAPGLETDWEMALLAGWNSIGHLFLFRDDLAADRWFSTPVAPESALGRRSRLWHRLALDIARDEEAFDADELLELLGPTPSAGGMIPKLLVAIPDAARWDGRIAPAGTRRIGVTAYTDVVLKVEPLEYRGVAALEALCLEIHRELDFAVPRFWRRSQEGMELLAVERFDRDAGRPVAMESLLSVLATGDRTLHGAEDTDLAELSQRLAKLATVCHLDLRVTRRELFRRVITALATGNGDLHLENLSLLGGETDARLAPVYDPAPMRAWPQHNVRSAIPIVFDPDLPLGGNLVALARAYDLARADAAALVMDILARTASFLPRVAALEGVPAARKKNLAQILRRERKAMREGL